MGLLAVGFAFRDPCEYFLSNVKSEANAFVASLASDGLNALHDLFKRFELLAGERALWTMLPQALRDELIAAGKHAAAYVKLIEAIAGFAPVALTESRIPQGITRMLHLAFSKIAALQPAQDPVIWAEMGVPLTEFLGHLFVIAANGAGALAPEVLACPVDAPPDLLERVVALAATLRAPATVAE